MTKSVETEVAGQISQHALLETFVPNLPKPMRKVAMDSTFPEGFCNLSHPVFGNGKVCNLQLATCFAMSFQEKLHERSQNATEPYIKLGFQFKTYVKHSVCVTLPGYPNTIGVTLATEMV